MKNIAILSAILFFTLQMHGQTENQSEKKHKQALLNYNTAITYLENKPDSSITFLHKTLALNQEDSLRCLVYMTLSQAHYYLDDLVNSEEYCVEAEKLALKLKNTRYLGRIYNILGIIERNKDNYAGALTYYEKALNIKLKSNDTLDLNVFYTNMGVLAEYMENLSAAKQYYEESRAIELRNGSSEDLSTSYINLGGIYIKLDKTDSAEYFLLKSLKIADSLNLGIDKEYDYDS